MELDVSGNKADPPYTTYEQRGTRGFSSGIFVASAYAFDSAYYDSASVYYAYVVSDSDSGYVPASAAASASDSGDG